MAERGKEALHPGLQQWLEGYNRYMRELEAGGFKPTPINVREGLDAMTRGLVREKPDIPWVGDDLISAPHAYPVPVRIYHPDPEHALPVLVYYHGGGHMAGSVSAYDPICRKLAVSTRHVVISVDYRLAPECPYPAGVTDAFNAAKHVRAALDSRNLLFEHRLRLAGDSAGGALSATVAHLAQHDAGLAVEAQALIYPSLDYTMSLPSIEENGTGYLLEKSKIGWYFDHYFQNAQDRKAASPLFMEAGPGFPDTLIVTAGFCPLRDEGCAYADRLKEAGFRVEHLHFADTIHAFLNMESLAPERTTEVYSGIGAFLRASAD
jgi:acetyl esterase/lipase